MSMHHNIKGAFFGLFMAFSYASAANFVKLAGDVPTEIQVFFRNFIGFCCFLPIVFMKRVSLKTDYIASHTVRVLVGLGSTYLYFWGIKKIALVEAIVLSNTIPLFVPMIILLWKKTIIPWIRLCGIIIGFIGVVVLVHPNFNEFNLGTLACLGTGFFGALGLIGVGQLVKEDKPRVILFYFYLLSTILSFAPMIIGWKSFDPYLFFYLFGMGFFSITYQMATAKTLTYLPASKGSCFIYLSVVFGGFYGWLFWGSVPDAISWIGATLVVIGGVWTLLEKKAATK